MKRRRFTVGERALAGRIDGSTDRDARCRGHGSSGWCRDVHCARARTESRGSARYARSDDGFRHGLLGERQHHTVCFRKLVHAHHPGSGDLQRPERHVNLRHRDKELPLPGRDHRVRACRSHRYHRRVDACRLGADHAQRQRRAVSRAERRTGPVRRQQRVADRHISSAFDSAAEPTGVADDHVGSARGVDGADLQHLQRSAHRGDRDVQSFERLDAAELRRIPDDWLCRGRGELRGVQPARHSREHVGRFLGVRPRQCAEQRQDDRRHRDRGGRGGDDCCRIPRHDHRGRVWSRMRHLGRCAGSPHREQPGPSDGSATDEADRLVPQ